MGFNKRKFLNFNKNNSYIAFEVAGFKVTPALALKVNGDEGEISFHIGFILGFWITFNGMWPRKWYPSYESKTHGQLPTSKEISIRFHNWNLWWEFWVLEDEMYNKCPKWRDSSYDFKKLIKGKHKCEFKLIEEQNFIISFIEGNYQVRVQKKQRYDHYSRARTKTMLCFDVKAGMIFEGKWIDVPIPVEGRGSAAHNCGEDATWSMYFPAKTKHRNFTKCYEAALYVEHKIKIDRIKNGGVNWVPKKFRNERIEILK